jgi:hypothetical protein
MVSQLGTTHSPIKPILIIGAPGSGTTLLYQSLCCHRDLAYITHNMLRAGIRKQGRLVGDRRKALFILQNLIHRDPASILPHEADAFWMTYFGYYDYRTMTTLKKCLPIFEKKYCKCRIFGVVHGL